MAIDVEFISIGMPHREYLVPFRLLLEKMQSIGCDLCNAEELKELGLKHSTAMFGESHEMAAKAGRRFPMTPAVQQFSFLNRWFIFRRKGELAVNVSKPKVATSVSVSENRAATGATTGAGGGEAELEGPAAVPAPPPTVAQQADGTQRRQYAPSEVLQFHLEAPTLDRLKIGKKLALRVLAPGWPFILKEPVTPAETYPSIEHFMAGMLYKHATDKPGLAQALFSPNGKIHQKFRVKRDSEKGVGAGAKELTDDRNAELLAEEMKEVHNEIKLMHMKKNGIKFDTAKWTGMKDQILEEAVRQRYTSDPEFRSIVEAAKQQGKTLLFYTGSASSEYGGKQTKEKYLEGENKLGKAIMKIAGFEQ